MQTLQTQIERILDQSGTGPVSVIVQFRTEDGIGAHADAVAQSLTNRRPLISARDLLPPRVERLTTETTETVKQRRAPAGRKPVTREDLKRTAPAAARKQTVDVLKTEAERSMLAAVRADWTRSALAAALPPQPKSRRSALPAAQTFWSSGSMVLHLDRDRLYELPNQLPQVSNVYPNRLVKLPPVSQAVGMPAVVADNQGYTWGVSRTGALACWGAFDARGKSVKVAVLDTGVDATHPDLKGRVADFAEFDQDGRKVLSGRAKAYDSGQHGTHCCATVVGGNASGRHIGMAPQAKVLAGLVLKNGSGTDAQILAGIDWAITAGADVISMSLGGLELGPEVLDTYTRSLANAWALGIPVVVAVGNEGSQTSGSPGNDYFAFTIGATDIDDRPAGFSGGRTQVITHSRYISEAYLPLIYSKPDVTAPGVDVYSAIPNGGYATWNGTSMATPHVAGAVALLLSEGRPVRDLTGGQKTDILHRLLTGTVKELGEAGQDHRFGFGRIDVLRAMGYATENGY